MRKETVSEKVEGGKLVRIEIDFNHKINSVRITGDFFLHPEESINEIEDALKGLDINESEKNIKKILENIIQKENIELVGINAEVIARLVKGTVK